jgi:hypothetical protein
LKNDLIKNSYLKTKMDPNEDFDDISGDTSENEEIEEIVESIDVSETSYGPSIIPNQIVDDMVNEMTAELIDRIGSDIMPSFDPPIEPYVDPNRRSPLTASSISDYESAPSSPYSSESSSYELYQPSAPGHEFDDENLRRLHTPSVITEKWRQLTPSDRMFKRTLHTPQNPPPGHQHHKAFLTKQDMLWYLVICQ